MDREPDIEALDIAQIKPWLNDIDRPLSGLMSLYPFLRTESEARRFLVKIEKGLADIRAGRVVSHNQVRRDVEERRRRHGLSAAE